MFQIQTIDRVKKQPAFATKNISSTSKIDYHLFFHKKDIMNMISKE